MKALRTDQSRMHLTMMLALTFTTGMIDAVGYLGLDRVFVANMTGNVVILGMGLTQADDLPVIGPVIGLLSFMLGAGIGGRWLRAAPTGWTGRTTVVFGTAGSIMLAIGISCFVVLPVKDTAWAFVITGLLAVAMGAQAATARRLAVADVTTVVVTSTIVGLASESKLSGGSGQNFPRRLLAVVLILAGAGVGALLLRLHIGVGMVAAGLLTVAVALFGHWVRELRSSQPA